MKETSQLRVYNEPPPKFHPTAHVKFLTKEAVNEKGEKYLSKEVLIQKWRQGKYDNEVWVIVPTEIVSEANG